MKRLLRISCVLLLVLAITYPAAAWYLGTQAEAAMNGPYGQIGSLPYLKVVKREYRRGVFSSDDTTIVELFGGMPGFLADPPEKQKVAATPDDPAPAVRPFTLTVRSHIRHGPFPDGKVFAAAIVDSELDIDERIRPDLAKVLGAAKVLTAQTVYGYGADGESLITSPPFTLALPGAGADSPGRLAWEGITATIRFTKNLESYTTTATAPKLEIAGQDAHIVIAQLRFATEGKRIFDEEPLLYSGKQQVAIEQVAIEGRGMWGKPVVLNGLSYDVHIPVTGEFIDILAKIGIRDVIIGESNFGPAHYDISLKRLHARSVAQLQRAMVKLYSDPAAMEGTTTPAEGFAPLANPTMKLLEFNPEVSVDRISFNSPNGEVLIAARAKFEGIKAEDFGKPEVFMAKLRASADIALPEALLMVPWGIKADSAEAEQLQTDSRQKQFAALAEQGYIRHEGAMVRSKIEFSSGQLTINGKPFDPSIMPERASTKAPPAMPPNAGLAPRRYRK